MKTILFFLFMFLMSESLLSQNIIIGDEVFGGVNIPFQDTIIAPPYNSDTEFYLDIDQDSIVDIKFWLRDVIGGMGGSDIVSVVTFGNFTVHTDTSYQEHYQYLVEGQNEAVDTVRTVTVVKKYNWGDTIYDNHISTNEEKYLLYYSWGNYPPCIYRNITLFNNDTSFIAFTKETGNSSRIYYLKVFVQGNPQIHLISAKSNDVSSYIDEKQLITNSIFPNPAKETINFRKAFDCIRIYTMQGTLLIEEKRIDAQQTLDISYLERGFYIVVLKTDSNRHITKLLKL